ncbi:MAG: hypothetical protein ACR2OW_13705 [Methyloligellaceae bacterium]
MNKIDEQILLLQSLIDENVNLVSENRAKLNKLCGNSQTDVALRRLNMYNQARNTYLSFLRNERDKLQIVKSGQDKSAA